MSEGKIKCSNCGEIVNTKLEKDTVCFDEIIYVRRCEKCGHMIETFSVKKMMLTY